MLTLATNVTLFGVGLILMLSGGFWNLLNNKRNKGTTLSSIVFVLGMAVAFLGYAGDGAACAILIGIILAAIM